MAKARAERGSVTAEASVSIGVIALAASGALGFAWLGFAQTWVRRASYEAAVCLAAETPARECRARLRTTLDGVFGSGDVRRIVFTKTGREARVDFELEILPGLVWRETRRLALPLKARGAS